MAGSRINDVSSMDQNHAGHPTSPEGRSSTPSSRHNSTAYYDCELASVGASQPGKQGAAVLRVVGNSRACGFHMFEFTSRIA